MKRLLVSLSLILMLASGAEAQRGGSSSRSYSSSGSSSSRGSSSSGSSRSYSSGSSSGSKNYSSGSKSYSSSPAAKSPSSTSRPSSTGYDSAARSAAQKSESKTAYVAASQPKSSYKTPTGATRTIDPKDRQIASLRSSLSSQKYENRRLREDNFYARYRTPTVVHYNDHYNPFLNAWLATQTVDIMANWMYHHRANMDSARYNAMLASNAALSAKISALEASKAAVDPSYVPPGIDNDLLYSDDYVKAAFNPQPAPTSSGWVGTFFTVVIIIFVMIVGWIVLTAFVNSRSGF